MLRTILIIATIVVVLGALAGGGYYWYTSQHADTPSQDITEVPIQREGLGEIPEATGIEPELGELPGESDRAIEAPAGEAGLLGEPSLETGPSPGDIETVEGPDTGDLEGTRAGGDISAPITTTTTQPRREPRPADNTEVRPVAESTESAEITETSPTPTPQPASTSPTPTPEPAAAATPTPKPAPAPGSYSVRTLQAVPEAKLAEVRKAMSTLNVTLQEQQTGQYHIQAYKLALGYFRTKAEAESWARSSLKPKGVDYFVYQTQNMFSIQVGVYTNPQNVDRAQRSLYEKFPGWRLPLRREVVTLSRNAYILSISKIHPDLADKIWRKLNQLGIQAEING